MKSIKSRLQELEAHRGRGSRYLMKPARIGDRVRYEMVRVNASGESIGAPIWALDLLWLTERMAKGRGWLPGDLKRTGSEQ